MLTTLDEAVEYATPAAAMNRFPGDDVAVWRTEMAPGSAGPAHTIDREHVVVVVEGQLTATVGGAQFVAAAGQSVRLPAHVERQLANNEAVALVLITAAVPGSLAQVGDATPVTVPWAA